MMQPASKLLQLFARFIAASAVALASMSAAGCGGATNVVSWKPQAATNPRARSRPAPRPVEPASTQVGASLLDDAYRETKVTWVAVPTPDGKKTRWVKVQ